MTVQRLSWYNTNSTHTIRVESTEPSTLKTTEFQLVTSSIKSQNKHYSWILPLYYQTQQTW